MLIRVVATCAGFVIGLIVGFILLVVVMTVKEDDEYRLRVHEWEKQRDAYDETAKRERAEWSEYQRKLAERRKIQAEWEKRHRRWENRYDDISIAGLAAQAKALTPQPTHWAVENPMPRIREWSDMMDKAVRFHPSPDMLPTVEVPAFASPESIPDTAPCMRAELCRIISEETTRPAIEDGNGTI